MTRDKDGQAILGGFLEAVAAGRIRTEGNLPGGGALFETCARAVEEIPEQLAFAPDSGRAVVFLVQLGRGVCPRCHLETKPGEKVYTDGACYPRCITER